MGGPDPKTRKKLSDASKAAEERFELLGTLGEGGMGRVLSYRDKALDRQVAVKIAKDKKDVETLQDEARILGTLRHQNIIPVYDIGEDADFGTFYVMPHLEQPTLQDALRALREGRSSHGRLLRLFIQVCQAVAYAHSRGVVHCDLKPANVLLGTYGEVFVADWGFAYRLGTKLESVGGTGGYMPPEQLKRREIDERVDVFALGVILYQLLTDDHPFDFIGFDEWDQALKKGEPGLEPPVPPSKRAKNRKVPAELEELCMRALHLDRDKRLTTVSEMVQALEAFVEGTKEKKRREKRATELCEEGQGLASSHHELVEALDERRRELTELRSAVASWSSAAEKESVWQAEDAERVLSTLASRTFQATVAAFEHALEEVPEHEEATSALGALYAGEFTRALGERDDAARRQFEALALEYDDGSFAADLAAGGTLEIEIHAARDVDVAVFELREHGAQLVAGPEVARFRPGGTAQRIPAGNYITLARRGEDVLASAPAWVVPGKKTSIELDIEAGTGAWVHVPGGPALLGGHESSHHGERLRSVEVASFSIRRLPITVREYFEFIGDVTRGKPAKLEALLPRDESGAVLWIWDAETGAPLPALASRWASNSAQHLDLPVVGVDLASARTFAAWLGGRSGEDVRLPRDDEWEKAARGVDGRRYPWGDRFDAAFCKTRAARSRASVPEPAGAFPVDHSPYGVRDTAGGVAEWVEPPPERVPAIRGGSWADWPVWSHLGARRNMSAEERSPSVGFRVVRL